MSDELTQLTHTIAQSVAHYLERQGLLVRLLGSSANGRFWPVPAIRFVEIRAR